MVHGREKLKEYLEMSFKNKAKSPVFIGRAKLVLCSVILFDFVFRSSLSEDYVWCKFVVSY
jgi:hypothetical protein